MATYNPTVGLQTSGGHKIKEISEEEYYTLIDTAARHGREKGTVHAAFIADRDKLLMEVLYTVGLRIGSAIRLEPNDVDLQKRTIKFWQEKKRTPYKHEVSISEDLAVKYVEYKFRYQESIIKNGGRMFALTAHGFRDRLRRYCNEAGIRSITPHAFRHGCAMALLKAGLDLHTIGWRLGHSSLLVTASTYARMNYEIERQQIERAFGGKNDL
jgi:integrase